MDNLPQKTQVLDAQTITGLLQKNKLPEGVSREEVTAEIRKIAEKASNLINECGGFPGPGIKSPSLARRFLGFLEYFQPKY